MKTLRLAFIFVLANSVAPPGSLSVLRVFPTEEGEPRTEVTVTFDRPVAGSLDATVDASKIFSIQPAVPGRIEWRDPITLRFVPATPFSSATTYRVTISNNFTAMDGTRLEQPYSFSFRIGAPRVLTGDPIAQRRGARFLPPRPTIRLLLSAPADPALVAQLTSIRMNRFCGGAEIPLEAVRIRRLNQEDPPHIRYTSIDYRAANDSTRDLRRIVELRPRSDLPRACLAELIVPERIEARSATQAWPFETYGPLRFVKGACALRPWCPTGPIEIQFTTPVRGSEVMRRVRVEPGTRYTINDTSAISDVWLLNTKLTPRGNWAVVVDSLLTDVFGQRLGGVNVKAFATTSYAPAVTYEFGKLLVERNGLRTLAAQVVNVDTLIVSTIAVPQAAEVKFLAQTWNWAEPFDELRRLASVRRVPVSGQLDRPFVTGIPLPLNDARKTRNGTLLAIRIKPARDTVNGPIALVQLTDLAIHGRMALDGGVVWVTGVRDGKPRAGATVTVYDAAGKERANGRTDAQGLVRFSNLPRLTTSNEECEECDNRFEGYVAATLNDDRAVTGFTSYDPDLAPWRFGVWSAWSADQRVPAAAAVFTERGIYRPGERVYAKAIVRTGGLGTLTAPRGDSVKWLFTDRDRGVIKDTTTALSGFGTADQSIIVSNDAPLGDYQVQVSVKHQGEWHEMNSASYQVAEYRPPEFLVDVNMDTKPRFGGDSMTASITARYLFGAPMAGAQVRWLVQHKPLMPWELEIPNTDGWQIGQYGDDESEAPESEVAAERIDTLDARGELSTTLRMPVAKDGRALRTGVIAVVTDANRQSVAAGRSIFVHPASFYIAARNRGREYFWRAGNAVALDVIAVRPTGERVSDVSVQGTVIRREWHRVRRVRDGQISDIGGWVSDTVATCRVQTASEPRPCEFTPAEGGSYRVVLTARDEKGRIASTSLWRWAAGPGFVPWNDDSQLKLELIADKQRYSVGDTATILVASPFTDVEAWLTLERERVIESRRMRITGGATTIRIPITEALAPNVYVSLLLVRGRNAAPGPLDDPGRPALRVGYTELTVLPATKRLTVELAPVQQEYRPGDDAAVRINVKEVNGRGQRSEVTLWAVDEGVLALTGYQTPDPVELLYQARPLGVRLSSNLVAVAAQVPAGLKGGRAPGGGGGGDVGAVLRSRFQTTAFFLGNVVTDENGNATATAKLPDNLTTFRVMAVAVTAGDRYGSGKSSLLVTRPLLARPSLPRFVRPGDRFSAGVVVNQRTGGRQSVQVQASARGIVLKGAKNKKETLNGTAGREVRFDFAAQPGDSANFQFSVRGGENVDAVAMRIPVRPNYHPLAQTIAGALRDTATAEFELQQDVDPARSRVEVSFGTSTLAIVRGARDVLRVYPYYCTEQVASTALPMIALYRAQRQLGAGAPASVSAEADVRTAIRVITRRQRPDGGIGYWNAEDWTSPWLTAYAARVLIEARAAGFPVDTTITNRIAGYLTRALHQPQTPQFAVARWYSDRRIELSERVAAVDVLSRLGKADAAVENTLYGLAAQLSWEDRLLLAEALARRNALTPARTLLQSAWQSVQTSGRKVVLPPNTAPHYFLSVARPAARLLTATLAINPEHEQVGRLVETLVDHGRVLGGRIYYWNTQDYGWTVLALLNYERVRRENASGTIRISGPRGALLTHDLARSATRDTTVVLTGLNSGSRVALRLAAENSGAPVYYYITVTEVPRGRAVNPIDRGITVERWYERLSDRRPTVKVAAGDLVRVKLRITVPDDRQFVVLDDPLPAGLEAVDLSLRTVRPPGVRDFMREPEEQNDQNDGLSWYFGSWDSGVWTPFDHKEMRDDRVVYFATFLWKGTYTATYLARATTPGTFIVPPAHAEEMYNRGVNGRTGGSEFSVTVAK